MMHRPTLFRSALALGCAAALMAPPAAAAIFRVGGASSGCTHATLQAAIAAAEQSPGRDVIRMTRSLNYLQQAVSITTSQELEITGGYLNCESINNDGLNTVINGSGGAQEPVFRVTGNTGSILTLRYLTITGGDEDGAGSGGGIFWRGNGLLAVEDIDIINNIGGYGGGIAAIGTGTSALLVVGPRTFVRLNTARLNGGGLYLESMETEISSPNTWITGNEATGVPDGGGISGGFGGGLHARSADHDSVTFIGSPGFGSAGVISGNRARFGGGVGVEGGENTDQSADIRLFSTNAANPTRIEDNDASVAGGGIHADVHISLTDSASADVYIYNANISDNRAPDGAAIFLGSDDDGIARDLGSSLVFNSPTITFAPPLPAGGANCPMNGACGGITGNVAPANGRVIGSEEDNYVYLNRALLAGNAGSELVRGRRVHLGESVVAGNIVSGLLVHADLLGVHGSTIAGNVVGATHVLSSGEFLNFSSSVNSSIVWQPGNSSIVSTGNTTFSDILSNDIGSFGGSSGARLSASNPRFVDPARGDYSLRAASPAVDFAPIVAGDDRDFLGLLRDRDMPIVPDRFGVRDIGAFERQVIDNIVLNRDFEVDLNLWTAPVPAAVIWQQEGAASVGAVRVDFGGVPPPIEGIDPAGPPTVLSPTGNPRLAALVQCIHLPGPGNYRLNGFARSAAAPLAFERDVLSIRWEFRAQGNEECNSNAANRTGEHFITSGTAWTSPATPTLIAVSPAEWTRSSSIRLQLIVEDRGLQSPPRFNGFFDGIKLFADVAAPSDVLFGNGFEQ